MKFIETSLVGAYLIEPEAHGDERGFLVRTFCADEFASQGLNTSWVQCSTVFNPKAGTLRGMHYQKSPHAEIKLVRCTMGEVQDVIIDLRPDSPTYKRWFSTELTVENRRSIYIPEGFAHGALTMVDHSELLYQMSATYHAESAAGVRWDDSEFDIQWQNSLPLTMSIRDANFPNFLP